MTALDATDPLVLDTRPLGRRAGAMVRVHRTFPAPQGWSVPSSEVEDGTPVDLEVRLESVVEGVLVTGSATVITQGDCSRCLDPVRGVLAVDIQQLFEYPDAAGSAPAEDDDPLPTLQGDLLDLHGTVRDAIVLDLPLVPLCSPECPGLCPTCGARLVDDPGHRHEEIDGRWAALDQWLTSNDDVPASGAGAHDSDEKGS